ncbi:methyl-accepting chemotaxis sensory transducer, partial [Candidatus Magnetoovum chiemensis]
MQTGMGATSETDAHPGTLNLDIQYSAVPIKNSEGKVIGAREFVIDQTVIKQAKRVADKIKIFQDNEVTKLLTGLEALAKGNMEFKLEVDAGDADTAVVRQMFDRLTTAINTCKSAINALVIDARMLSRAAIEGKLATRADAAGHQGEFGKIVAGVNDTLDAVIVPLNMAAKYIERISVGDLPPKITDEYTGDFNSIKNNLNLLIDAMNNVAEVAQTMAEGDLTVNVQERSSADKLMQALNAMIRNLKATVGVAEKIATGDLSVKVNLLSEKDTLGLALKQMVTDLREVVMDVRTSANNVSGGSQQLSATAEQMSQGATEQAASAEEASSSMEQMS